MTAKTHRSKLLKYNKIDSKRRIYFAYILFRVRSADGLTYCVIAVRDVWARSKWQTVRRLPLAGWPLVWTRISCRRWTRATCGPFRWRSEWSTDRRRSHVLSTWRSSLSPWLSAVIRLSWQHVQRLTCRYEILSPDFGTKFQREVTDCYFWRYLNFLRLTTQGKTVLIIKIYCHQARSKEPPCQ